MLLVARAIVASNPAVSSARRARASRSSSDALAQLLDLALGLQNAARLVRSPAADDVRAAKHDRRPVSPTAANVSRLAAAAWS